MLGLTYGKGHSLGASYAALFYAELLRLYNNAPIAPLSSGPPTCVLRDLYSFGCPRFGLADFADVFALAMDEHEGSCWRILARDDPVGLVPPVLITDSKFIHLDRAYEVSESESPVEIPSERNSHPRPPLPVVTINMSNHSGFSYVFLLNLPLTLYPSTLGLLQCPSSRYHATIAQNSVSYSLNRVAFPGYQRMWDCVGVIGF